MNNEYLQSILSEQIKQSLKEGNIKIDISGLVSEYAACGGNLTDELDELLRQHITLLTEQSNICSDSYRNILLVNLVSACRCLLPQ